MIKYFLFLVATTTLVICNGCICHQPLFPVYIDQTNGYGYIDRQGNMVICPGFFYAGDFHDGLAHVRHVDDWGAYYFIDSTGNEVMRLPWERYNSSASHFSEGLVAAHSSEGGERFYDRSGMPAFSGQFEMAGDFSCGLAEVKLDGRWGYIDKSGNMAITNKFRLSLPFEGKGDAAPVMNMEGKWGIIDRTGEYLVEPTYSFISTQHEGCFIAVTNRKCIYIDRHGRQIVDGMFDSAGGFSEGLAHVVPNGKGRKGKSGFIDRNGKFAIPAQYDLCDSFSEGMAAVEVDGLWGYIDRKGRMVVEPKFFIAESFKNGLARVWLDGMAIPESFGYIDKKGNYVWKPRQLLKDGDEAIPPSAEEN